MSDCLPPSSNLPDEFDLIVFTDSVVKSTTVDKAFKRRNKDCDRSHVPALLMARNFTQDCRIFEGDCCQFASLRDFHWTDSRYEYIRTISASKVKTPDIREREITKTTAEQAGTGQPATRSQSKSEVGEKPQSEAEGRSR